MDYLPWHAGGERTTSGSLFSPSALWVLGMELKLSGLGESIFSCRAILPAHSLIFDSVVKLLMFCPRLGRFSVGDFCKTRKLIQIMNTFFMGDVVIRAIHFIIRAITYKVYLTKAINFV